jgi:hypothetical protein
VESMSANKSPPSWVSLSSTTNGDEEGAILFASCC